jgi:hypothetical protein
MGKSDFILDMNITYERGDVTFLGRSNADFFYNSFELISPEGRLYGLNGGRSVHWNDSCNDPIYNDYKILDETSEVIQKKFTGPLKYVPKELESWFTSNETNLTSFKEAFLNEKIVSDQIARAKNEEF